MILKTKTLTVLTALIVATSLLGGVSPAQDHAQNHAQAHAASTKVQCDDHTHKHSHIAGYVKPGAAVEITHNYDGQTDIGQTETIKLSLNHFYDHGYLTTNIVSSPNVSVTSSAGAYPAQLYPGSEVSVDLQVSSHVAGTYFVGVESIYESLDGHQTRRMLTVPITIGAKSAGKTIAAPAQTVADKPKGIVTLSAREVIR
jgi:hypothetical protein